MKNHKVLFLAFVVFGVILAACATPPSEEMDRAHNAVIRAENDADAVNYAPDTLVRARDALTRMQAEADARRFDAARNFAAEAIHLAERAIAEGHAGAGRARNEAASLVDSLSAPLAQVSSALNVARQASDLALDFDALSWSLDSARRSYNGARISLEENNYMDAIAQAQNARLLLADISARMNQAAQLAGRK